MQKIAVVLAAVSVAMAVPLAAIAQEGHVVNPATAKFDVVPNIPTCFKAAVLRAAERVAGGSAGSIVSIGGHSTTTRSRFQT